MLHIDPQPGAPEPPDRITIEGQSGAVTVAGIDEELVGETVTATGFVQSGVLNATTVHIVSAVGRAAAPTRSSTAGAYTAQTVRTAYLLTRFASDSSDPNLVASARTTVFGSTNSVAAYYRESSDGGITITGDVLGWYTVDPTFNGDGTPRCDWETWAAQGKAAAIAAGINMSQYQEVVVAGPSRIYCPFAGVAYVGYPGEDTYGKPRSYINGGGLFVIAHEVGHILGASHASSFRCTANGVPVVLSESCTRSEYADPFSVMGSSTRLHQAQQAYRIAQVINNGIPTGKVATATGNGTYTLARRHSSSGTQLLRIPRGNTGSSFDLELRARTGSFDNFASGSNPVSGVMIRIAPTDWNDVTQSRLLDATPASESFDDAAFTVGTSMVDPSTGTTIRITAVSATSATVVVGGMTDTTPPSAPSTLTGTATVAGVSLRWSAATDNTAVASYQIAQDGTLIGSSTTTTFTATGVFPNTSHTYTVWARDRSGNAGPALATSVRTLPDTTPPSGVGTLRATATSTSITVTWMKATDNVLIYGYLVKADASDSWVDPASCCTKTFSNLAPGSSHVLTVRAIDGSGNQGALSQLTVSTKASGK